MSIALLPVYHQPNTPSRRRRRISHPQPPETIPCVLNAILSQATSWSNAKNFIKNMARTHLSVFACAEITTGGLDDTMRYGGLHVRKSKIILSQIRDRHGEWNLDFPFGKSDKGSHTGAAGLQGVRPQIGLCRHELCLLRNSFSVNTQAYRIAGVWGGGTEKMPTERRRRRI